MFPSQGELGTGWGWGSPWEDRPQRYYPLRLWLEWAWPRDTGLGRDMGQGVILPRGTLVGVSQLGRSPWLGSVIGVIWQRSGVSQSGGHSG